MGRSRQLGRPGSGSLADCGELFNQYNYAERIKLEQVGPVYDTPKSDPFRAVTTKQIRAPCARAAEGPRQEVKTYTVVFMHDAESTS